MNKIAIFFVFLMLMTPAYAGDKDVFRGDVTIQAAFLTGEQFLNLSESARLYYTMGIIDGFMSAPMFGGDNRYLNWVFSCVKGKTKSQISAILVKYLNDNPAKWNEMVQWSMFEALVKACN